MRPCLEIWRMPALDFTENGRTGDLFGPGGDVIEGAERLWAASLGFDSCLFLTGGSTQGIHTGLLCWPGVGGVIALDRGSHRAAYNALALLGLVPHYLPRPWVTDEGVTGPIEPEQVEQTLRTHPEIKTICIVSPTYYGVISDLPAIARVCHSYGARLMVDGRPWRPFALFRVSGVSGGGSGGDGPPTRPSPPWGRPPCCWPTA